MILAGLILFAATCNASGLTAIDAAMKEVAPEDHGALVAEGLSEGCASAFPPSLTKALHTLSMPGMDPSTRKMAGAKAIEENASLWTKACAAGPRGLLISMRDNHRAEAWDACHFDAKTFATREEYVAATGLPELGALVLRALADANVGEKRARIYARAIAGIANPGFSRPKPTPIVVERLNVPEMGMPDAKSARQPSPGTAVPFAVPGATLPPEAAGSGSGGGGGALRLGGDATPTPTATPKTKKK